ncbi:unnamed protein product [Penicillium viridicatum]
MTKGDPQDIGMHTIQHQSDGDGESSQDAILETETPSLNPLTTLDTNPACRNEVPGCSQVLSTTSNMTPLSDLSKTPSLDVSGSDKAVVGCSSRMELLGVLPSCQRIDRLIEKYFTSISMLFCVIDAASFKAEYEVFCHDPYVASQSWLSLLLAILALACRAEEDPGRGCLSDDLSMLYEKAAWSCLLTNEPPSLSSLKAIILIIYGRTHRGEDVFSDLQLAYRTAASTQCHIDTMQCAAEPMVCEEYRCLLIGLKMLSLLNAQIHDYYRNRDLTQGIERLADTYESTERSHLPISVEGSPATQMIFTILSLQLLEISDIIFASVKGGLMSECSLAGVEIELHRMEKHCSEIYTKLGESNSEFAFHQGSHCILHCYINYIIHLLFLPDLQRYIDGDITPETRESQLKCIAFAKSSLQNFNLLAENMQFACHSWYIRGLGSYYAEQSAYTLTKSLAELKEDDQDQDTRSILNRTLAIFSALSDRSIFSARGAFVIENQCKSRLSKAISRALVSNFTPGFCADTLGGKGRYLVWSGLVKITGEWSFFRLVRVETFDILVH